MLLNRVTLTGADDKTNPAELQELSKKYPFVEWGILFSSNREGFPRYPTHTKIDELISIEGAQFSAHFCGWYSRQVLESRNVRLLMDYHKKFNRIQLNYNFGRHSEWDTDPLMKYLMHNKAMPVILQVNKSNKLLMDDLSMLPVVNKNLHMLYDSSGGRGVVMQKVELPYEKNYTGYSGGINPENVAHVCGAIKTHPLQNEVWIDMESGVRTDDCFDLSKCEEVLEICKQYIQ